MQRDYRTHRTYVGPRDPATYTGDLAMQEGDLWIKLPPPIPRRAPWWRRAWAAITQPLRRVGRV